MSRIKISLKGNNVRRFINLCSINDIQLYDLKFVSSEEYTCIINTNDYYQVKKHLKKTRTKSKVLNRIGVYRLYKPFMKYWYCLLPFIVITLFLYWKTLKIADVVVTGCDEQMNSSIERYMNSNNFGVDTWIRGYDFTTAECLLKNKFTNITWSSIGINGNVLYVEVREATNPEIIQDNRCRSIVASKDAIVYSIITRKGTPLVKAGDVVMKGDVLVDSKQEILDDNLEVKDTYFTQSDADILGYVDRKYSESFPCSIGFLEQDDYMMEKLAEAALDKYVLDLEENGVLILSKNVIMDKVGNCMYLNVHLKTIESIVKYSY